MPWEQRGKWRYFYLAQRVNGRPRRIYAGRGAVGELHEQLFAERRRRREREQQAWRVELARLATADDALGDLKTVAVLVAHACLLVAGYHEHRGQWRRRSETTNKTARAGGRAKT